MAPMTNNGASRALVLAGGGVIGIGWELGVMLGLRAAGVSETDWARIVGTSAGSVVGAALSKPGQLEDLGRALAATGGGELATHLAGVDATTMAAIDELWFGPAAAVDGPGEHARIEIGRLGSLAGADPGGRYLAGIAALLPTATWPAALTTTAVDIADGSLRTFDARSGVPLATAVAASCAIPGIFAPVSIGGRRYMDGGVRSASNADLAVGHDLVVVIWPQHPDGPWAARFACELAELRAGDSRVVCIEPDGSPGAAFEVASMDPSETGMAVAAGHAVGLRAAGSLE
jgi:NTE family protein